MVVLITRLNKPPTRSLIGAGFGGAKTIYMITTPKIKELAARPGVKKIAVENFLISLSGNQRDDLMNLKTDARLYGWNKATTDAIETGIEINYGS